MSKRKTLTVAKVWSYWGMCALSKIGQLCDGKVINIDIMDGRTRGVKNSLFYFKTYKTIIYCKGIFKVRVLIQWVKI